MCCGNVYIFHKTLKINFILSVVNTLNIDKLCLHEVSYLAIQSAGQFFFCSCPVFFGGVNEQLYVKMIRLIFFSFGFLKTVLLLFPGEPS